MLTLLQSRLRLLIVAFTLLIMGMLRAEEAPAPGPSNSVPVPATADLPGPKTDTEILSPAAILWLRFCFRSVGWLILGLFGAGSLAAILRGKPTHHVFFPIIGWAAYRTYGAYQESISVIPPLLCFLVIVLFTGMAKTAADNNLEDDDEGYSRRKRY